MYLLANAERRTKDFDAAEATAERLIAAAPDSPSGPFVLAQIHEDQRRYDKAASALRPVVARLAAQPEPPREVLTLMAHLGFAELPLLAARRIGRGPRQPVKDGALARTVSADEAHRAAGRDGKRKIGEGLEGLAGLQILEQAALHQRAFERGEMARPVPAVDLRNIRHRDGGVSGSGSGG